MTFPGTSVSPADADRDEAYRLAVLHALGILDTPAEERFDRITRLARRVFQVPVAGFNLVDFARMWFKSRQGENFPAIHPDESFCGYVVRTRAPLVVADTLEDSWFAQCPIVAGEPHFRFYAGYPIHGPRRTVLGTFCVFDYEPRVFGNTELESLADFASITESEVNLHRLSASQRHLLRQNRQFEHSARVDSLTKLWNRETIRRVIRHECESAAAKGHPLAIMMIDVDRFKAINDTHGHLVGDDVLVEVATRLRRSVRPSDTVGRFGGDEFIVCLPRCPRQVAADVAQRLVDSVAAASVSGHGATVAVSISVGVGFLQPGQKRAEAVLRAADKALYRSKHSGRGRATVDD